MGCENSQQLVQPAPHQPHHLPPEEDVNQVPVPPSQPVNPQPSKDQDDLKENSRPRQNSKKQQKVLGDAQNINESRKKVKSEQHVGEVPMADCTNISKQNLVIDDSKRAQQKRQSKRLSAREIQKKSHQDIGPSSKTIEKPEEEAQPVQTGVQEFPITNVLKEENVSVAKEEEKEVSVKEAPVEVVPPVEENKEEKEVSVKEAPVESVSPVEEPKIEEPEKKQAKTEALVPQVVLQDNSGKISSVQSQKIQISPFSLDQFEASSKPKPVNVQSEEVENYLSQLWTYQGEVIDTLITKLQQKQMKKYTALETIKEE